MGDEGALERVARFCIQEAKVDRAVYLDADGALERVVLKWAERLAGPSPADSELWTRAARRCLQATPAEIEAFVQAERERSALRVLEALPSRRSRSVELLCGKLVVLVHDRADLDEDDILPAAVLVFGNGAAPMIRRVGSRWFLSPGALSSHGLMVLDELDDGIGLDLYHRDLTLDRSERLSTWRGANLRVAERRR